jgi:hypothetical protein
MNSRSSVTRRLLAALAGAAACAMVSACSAPGVFPSLFGDPPPRDQATMTPDQVKQATDNLISDREHLHSCAAQIASAAPDAAPPDCAGAAGAPTNP